MNKLLKNKREKIILDILDGIRRSKLPNRKNRVRHEPRAVIHDHRSKFPILNGGDRHAN